MYPNFLFCTTIKAAAAGTLEQYFAECDLNAEILALKKHYSTQVEHYEQLHERDNLLIAKLKNQVLELKAENRALKT